MPPAAASANGDPPTDLPSRVMAGMERRVLTVNDAAREIGVTTGTLRRHLAGEHIRSDSIRKYEDWLAGRPPSARVFRDRTKTRNGEAAATMEVAIPPPPRRPRIVVDIFSGCGGLSLGFDLLGGSGQADRLHFRTVMALDIQSAAIDVLNDNHPAPDGSSVDVGRQVDLTEFRNEAEILAFYMDHVTRLHDDRRTHSELLGLDDGRIRSFLSAVRRIDSAFLRDLERARRAPSLQGLMSSISGDILGQSSVQGFHDRLKLPRWGRDGIGLPLVLWADDGAACEEHDAGGLRRLRDDVPELLEASTRWDREMEALEGRETTGAKGQLTSSGRRIAAFVAAARSNAFQRIRDAWCQWQAHRDILREKVFGKPGLADELRDLMARSYPVSVLLGGPPCQGFSRIGRGKIRSLHEVSVHAHQDGDAGDARNHLYRNYVMVVSALRPEVFAFENVPQFQSTVRVGAAEFLATRMLTEAIATMSGDHVAYAVSSKTLDASRHGVPQTRQRFFMVGVRADLAPDSPDPAAPCLAFPERESVPLASALEGLPSPHFTSSSQGDGGLLGATSLVHAGKASAEGAALNYLRWVTQPRPGMSYRTRHTDAHVARTTREDDALLYEMMGPGKRWMDYRADDAPTLTRLRDVVAALAALDERDLPPGLPDAAELRDLSSRLNGSLPLRLLLEQISRHEGAAHHLLRDTYLDKRAGNHGDWLTRLDASVPCRTIVAHMGKDSYGYVHPSEPRTLSVREAARVQTFPDWFSFGRSNMSEAFKMIGNAVPPLLSHELARRVAVLLHQAARRPSVASAHASRRTPVAAAPPTGRIPGGEPSAGAETGGGLVTA